MPRILALLLILSSSHVAASAAELKLLFLGDQAGHKPATRFALLQPVMAAKDIQLTYTEDVSSLNLATLNQYDGLVLYANIDTIEPQQAAALLEYVASGRGFIPIHCATYCFRNNEEVVALMGAQFQRHGGAEMTTESSGADHSIIRNYDSFRSWDETYVHHKHNNLNRVVLEYRAGDMQADGNTREPWTWIRAHGQGRVFYTAWGHDERTWSQPGFHDLLERGIRWACGEGELGIEIQESIGPLASLKPLPSDLPKFEYVDVGKQIPNYPASKQWGVQEEPLSSMQLPAPALESMQHIATPEGMHVELFADESMLDGKMFGGKPIAMNWDPQGRLWICETVDYPNELKNGNRGRDRVRVLEDTNGDFVADKSTIFAEDLSIPTAIAFHRGGVIVQNGTETLFLKDTNNDGLADQRKVLISDWKLIDTHGGVSNFRNGLDNWIWAMQGYNDSSPVINGVEQPSFRMGFFRFKLSQDDDPIVEKLEFIRSTTNNTWGLGISEEGLIFGSTANRAPSFFMPIANRYYERVRGWAPQTLSMICPTHEFSPITDKVRQVDHHGGYTAGAGHALYTARNYPQSWWNRTAFVCGPTGKLVGTFVIERDGAGMKSHSPTNLFASQDEWTAPIMAEVGPDGNVWVLDWYNYIVQHNPTPRGFETGKGRAYESDLRDKKHGRIYRVVPDQSASGESLATNLGESSTTEELLAALGSPTMLVRLHAQRLLIESGNRSVIPRLLQIIANRDVDPIGLNTPAIHALNTLAGLGENEADSGVVFDALAGALSHPSAGVRLNAICVMPETQATIEAMNAAGVISHKDAQVVLAALLKISDSGADSDSDAVQAGPLLSQAISSARITSDQWLADALTSAGAMHAERFLNTTLQGNAEVTTAATPIVARIAEHFARTQPDAAALATLVDSMSKSRSSAVEPIIKGLGDGWPKDYGLVLDDSHSDALRAIFAKCSDASKASMARLAAMWSNNSLNEELAPIIDALLARAEDAEAEVQERLAAAEEVMQLAPFRTETAEALQSLISPRSPVSLSSGLLQTLSRSRVDGLADRYLKINDNATPEIREALIRVMLSRPELTDSLVAALETGQVQIRDLTIEQRSILGSHPSPDIRNTISKLLRDGGVVISNDRSQLLESKMALIAESGNPELGKAVFSKHCASCHVFKGEGNIVGPNLNGMSVHPKSELLTHILDPNRSVEANYRLYTILTADGVVISGLLSGESLTTIEMVDTQGKRHTILREEIEQLRPSTKSAMPEGFEQSIDDQGLTDLLEYLTQSEQYVPLGIEQVANVKTTEGMFYDRNGRGERIRLRDWGVQSAGEVPFYLIDPTLGYNAIMLHGPIGPFAPKLAKQVDIRCKTAAKSIHILGGVGGWAARTPGRQGVSMIVRLQYSDGKTEDHELINGQHIADYNGLFEVPQSKLAFKTLDGGQIRQLVITPLRDQMIETIQLIKADHNTAPVVMAITVEPLARRSH